MSGWRRSDFFDASGLPWVPPSPNMPTPDTALVYSGTCLFEGTNLSEGRGTTRPFELLGAEGIDRRWAAAANALGLPGVALPRGVLRADVLQVPGEDGRRRADSTCTTGRRFDPVRTGIALLVTAKQVVERVRLALGQLDRQAHGLHPGAHDDRRGRRTPTRWWRAWQERAGGVPAGSTIRKDLSTDEP